MKPNLKKTIYCLLAIFLLGQFSMLNAQNDISNEEIPDQIEYPAYRVQKIRTFNTLDQKGKDWMPSMKNSWVAPAPGIDVEKELFKALKLKANEERDANWTHPVSQKSTGTQATLPTLGENFFGPLSSGTPNDNDVAVNTGGKVIAVVNTTINMYRASSGAPAFTKGLAPWVGIAGNAFVFDPKVIYDPEADRFIVVFLEGNSTGDSKVHIVFSATSDPFGAWHFYSISGVVGGRWTDFPQIGVSTQELFITGNMANNGQSSVVSGSIRQVNKWQGYNGAASLAVKDWAIAGVGWHPVQGAVNIYGPQFYFIRSNNIPFGNTKTYFIREIKDTQANGGTLSSQVTLSSNAGYSLPADIQQKDIGVTLQTNSAAILSSYFENNKIQFVQNTQAFSRPSLLYGTIEISSLDLSFSGISGSYISIDSFQIAYPGVAWCGDDGFGENKSIVMFNFASPQHFPGNAVVEVDENGSVSPPLVTKYGFAPMQNMSGNPTRYGDYAGADERTNNPGEVWIAGSIGRAGSSSIGTWVSQVFGCGATVIAVEDEVEEEASGKISVYNNPVFEFVKFDFEVPETNRYQVMIHDLNGKRMEEFPFKTLKKGKAFFSFNTGPLASGIYLLSVRSENGQIYSEKISVSR